MPLCRRQARLFHRGWLAKYLGVDDLVAIGLEAVWRATVEYDANRGASFGTYVTMCVVNALRHEHVRYRTMKRAAVTSSLTSAEGDAFDLACPWPTPEELLAQAQIRSLVAELPVRLRRVIEARFFEGVELEVVGNRFDVTRERARQLETDGLRLLRTRLWAKSKAGIRRVG
jgi:RNA polymerase sigma factor (sigma-70 family)